MRKLKATWVAPISEKPIPNGMVVLDDRDVIIYVGPENKDYPEVHGEIFEGLLCPGFINTHCHLELSHMKNIAPTGTGLLPFIKTVVSQREVDFSLVLKKIEEADQEMSAAGIVAVGDICNKADTAVTKMKSNIRYYSFIEMFDFHQSAQALKTYSGYMDAYNHQYSDSLNPKICVPHAPYSVSPQLFELINQHNEEEVGTISIHNQETPHEIALFQDGSGGFPAFFGQFGMDYSHFPFTRQSPVEYAISHMDPRHRTLWVHNTLTTASDIQKVTHWNPKSFWATCPNANLYIENRLPHYQTFLDERATMTIGTDSLTSNWQLSILEEIKTILKYQSSLPFMEVLTWGTLNGAQALGFDDHLGSLEKGKAPGINLLTQANPDRLNASSQVQKIC